MKRITIVCLTGLLFFTACENGGSSTVGSYEKEETSQSSEKSENKSHGGQSHGEQSHSGQVKESTEGTATDTLPTSGDAPHERSGVEIKTGANVPVDSTRATRP